MGKSKKYYINKINNNYKKDSEVLDWVFEFADNFHQEESEEAINFIKTRLNLFDAYIRKYKKDKHKSKIHDFRKGYYESLKVEQAHLKRILKILTK